MYQIIKSEFFLELEREELGFDGKCCVILLYASTDVNIRKRQWDILKEKRNNWGRRWILGWDFNEIMTQEGIEGLRVHLLIFEVLSET